MGLSLYIADDNLEKVFKFSPIPMSLAELESGIILDVNHSWCELTGFKREDVLGKTYNEIEAWFEPPNKKALWQELYENSFLYNIEAPWTIKGKGQGKALISLLIVEIQGKKCLLTLAKDISEAALLKAELISSRAELQIIINRISDGFYSLDRDFCFTYVNPIMKEIGGKSAEQLLGRCIWDVFPEMINTPFHETLLVSMTSEEPQHFEVPSIILDNRLYEVHTYPATDGVSVLIRDITQLRHMEVEMLRYERLNVLAEMAASISHEVRNPMTTVRGFLQLLSQKPECSNLVGYFELMIAELDRANSIMTQYLSFGRNEESQQTMTSLSEIITHLLPLIQADALEHSMYLESELHEVPNLLLNTTEISQLILNLVRNGLEAMEPHKRLTITTYSKDNLVYLVVKDEGCGIKPAIMDKIGQPFFTTKKQGTGLGLSTCHRIAAKHAGRIDIDSSSQGTTVTVSFRVDSVAS